MRRDKINQIENNMTTMTPVDPLLDRLFEEAGATTPASIPDFKNNEWQFGSPVVANIV
jgi:hypothetical protein